MGFDLADGINWYLVFLFSTSYHEAAHAWSASLQCVSDRALLISNKKPLAGPSLSLFTETRTWLQQVNAPKH